MSNFGHLSLLMCVDVTVEILEMEFLSQSKQAFEMLIALVKLPSQEMCQL